MPPSKPPLADQAATIDSFLPEPEQTLRIMRRSELQAWATCPAMARFGESGSNRIFADMTLLNVLTEAKDGDTIRVDDLRGTGVMRTKLINTSSDIANAGEEVHKAVSAGIQYYIDPENRLQDDFSRRGMQEVIEVALLNARLDVQPEAIEGLRRSIYAITDHIFNWNRPIPPNRIHRFDGGQGERSGQLAMDIPDLGVRLTSELDLLYETEIPTIWVDEDWKSGNKLWTAADVKHSFQFGMHAWLVFKNYEHVRTLVVRISNTRKNVVAREVEFHHEDINQYEYRLRSAVEVWRQWRDVAPEQCPTWPSIEKCTICDAADRCPVSGYSLETVEECLGVVVALRAQLAAREKRLTAIADKRGEPIEWKDARWGRDAPKDPKKPTAKLWKVKE